MKQVIEAFRRQDAEQRIPVLRLEIDYELSTLFDAIQVHDQAAVTASKERLDKYRQEMLRLEA
ncbi:MULTISPECIES: hypothetical protein [Exiguobacterium]|jgi:hypothetical protein|uniref:Uncharacterized protein n=1 Tax=Exiguobacterium sibiricum (strain DSM 17290 / CCUG 55495 / CIP 109462 / JCM 13490 / 255-15) TaxID=262543 RepID=B1YK75_EXIS2|nr:MULTISPECIES: hypothetical protein [Exiguobacterium]ACB60156.1 conserved hypothetical protein [Exiguobacterium sibiricum 255-15]MCT4791929.1 hypothetical protein [Exiguobacterium artemiae]MDW2887066.1 hypothetical protein [Exiguobacterium sibiricum]MDX1259671.1 hypothetical protein [Exiguobacterium sp. K1]QNR20307.1 hypothetical protein HNY42_04965 [Exiguobacterium sp. Helios]